MALTINETRHVATWARLELGPEEEERFREQMSSILDYIGQLNELDTANVKPTSHSLDITNVFRSDGAKEIFGKGIWTGNAPQADHGHFRVPKVLD